MLALVAELDPDALVVGNRDMQGRLRLHRSVARVLAHRAACDVVIIDTVGRRQHRRGQPARALRWA
jgi:nucleotide-binding universal stress UspA family protein